MITANTLAKKSDVPLYTVRHYTRIGLLKPVRNSTNGYNVYQPSDTTRLHFIVAAKSLGFTLHEISDVLAEAKRGNSTCPMVRVIIERHIDQNRRKIKELQLLQDKMETALTDWEQMGNSMPNGDSVCHLIESVAEVKKSA